MSRFLASLVEQGKEFDAALAAYVDLLVGTSYTPNALAMSHVSTQAKVPFFSVNASTSGTLAKAPYTAQHGTIDPDRPWRSSKR